MERFNQTIKNIIEILLARYKRNHLQQDILDEALKIYKQTIHSTIGCTLKMAWNTLSILHLLADRSRGTAKSLDAATLLNDKLKELQRKKEELYVKQRTAKVPSHLKLAVDDVVWHVKGRNVGLKRKRGEEARDQEMRGVILERARNNRVKIQWITKGPSGEKPGSISSKWYPVSDLQKSSMSKDNVVFDEGDEGDDDEEILDKDTSLNSEYFEDEICDEDTSGTVADSCAISSSSTGTPIRSRRNVPNRHCRHR